MSTSTRVHKDAGGKAARVRAGDVGDDAEQVYTVHKRAETGAWVNGVAPRRERRGKGNVIVDGFGSRIFGRRLA